MTSFELLNSIWELFSNDDELLSLLNIENDNDLNRRIRTENAMYEEFDVDDTPFVAIYIYESSKTYNYLVNRGFLCIEVYADSFTDASPVIKRVVSLMHDVYDYRIAFEGQFVSELSSVYKYRVAFAPLISS